MAALPEPDPDRACLGSGCFDGSDVAARVARVAALNLNQAAGIARCITRPMRFQGSASLTKQCDGGGDLGCNARVEACSSVSSAARVGLHPDSSAFTQPVVQAQTLKVWE